MIFCQNEAFHFCSASKASDPACCHAAFQFSRNLPCLTSFQTVTAASTVLRAHDSIALHTVSSHFLNEERIDDRDIV